MHVPETPPSYDGDFFRRLEPGVWRSASIAAGLICETFGPRSVVDLGCGTGIWLAALREMGVTDVLGVDGDWVPRELLTVPEKDFLAHDLTAPLTLGRRFDLALCLEAAEHLPPEAAGGLIDSLVRLAPVVVFSAAVPGQGGHGHVNERWPSYWSDLFARHGYRASSVLRNRLWYREEVEPWYRQNLLCFVAGEQAERLGPIIAAREGEQPIDVVHPAVLSYVRDELAATMQEAARLQQERDTAKAQLESTSRRLRHIKYGWPNRARSSLRRPARQ